MSDERDDAHGRLGRLFAALVNNEDDVDNPEAPEAAATSDDTETSSLDVEALSRSLMGSPDPMGVLRGLVADVRARSEEGPGEKDAGSSPVPSPFELYLAMRLTEAGLLEDDVSLPMTSVVRPRTSDLFYLRVIDESLPWLAKLKILRIELMGAEMRSWGVDTLEVLYGTDGGVRGLRVADLDWSSGRPERVAGSEREIPAQLVLIACGFTGPEAAVLEAFGVHAGERGLPLAGPSVHRADAAGETPVFLAGDVRTGSSLVVNAISDAVACAGEVAAMLEA